MSSYLENYQKEDLPKLHLFTDKLITLENLYSVNVKLQNALREKVWLKSGGTIIIQPTEALTGIDVLRIVVQDGRIDRNAVGRS
jgi:ribonuclease G